jgi:glyoxylase-like metal-dependent hydrolase (beta-lactamase superfamily II)
MERSYGTLVPVPAERTRITHDGMDLMLGTRHLHFIDTPGHARHHHCVWDERSRGWFTGDTFGISYREFDTPARGAWVSPSSVPTQFEPELLRASVQRLLAFDPACMYLTHYARVDGVPRLATRLIELLDATVAIGQRCANAPERHRLLRDELTALYSRSLREHGIEPTAAALELIAVDIELNAQGIGIWLDREAARTAA